MAGRAAAENGNCGGDGMKQALKWAGLIAGAAVAIVLVSYGAIGIGEAISWIGGAR